MIFIFEVNSSQCLGSQLAVLDSYDWLHYGLDWPLYRIS